MVLNETSNTTYGVQVSGGQQVSVFVSGKTSLKQWEQQLVDYGQAPFVELVVKRNGKPIAVIVSFEEYQNLVTVRNKQEKNQTYDDVLMFK